MLLIVDFHVTGKEGLSNDIHNNHFQRPDLFTTDEMGTSDWMTLGDVTKLRHMYGCEDGK